MADVQQLLVQIDASTESLRRELKRAEQPLNQFERQAKKTTTAQEGMQAALRRNAQAIAVLQGPLGGVAGRISSLGALVGAINPLLAASALAFAALGTAIGKSVKAAENFERAGLKTEAILRATGGASGQTADSIRQMSREIARATLSSVQGTEKAAQKLLTFRSVAGDTFRRTLELSQDLAEVGFGNIETAAVQLGKALEDPSVGLSALTRVGVSFSQKQKDVIQSLYDTGDALGAQKLLLDAVEQQVGGAGAAAGGGLTGAYDSLGQSAEELLEKLGRTSTALYLQTNLINNLDNLIRGLDLAIFGDTSVEFLELNAERNKLVSDIVELEKDGNKAGAEISRQGLARIEAQIFALVRLQDESAKATLAANDNAQAQAAANRAVQDADRATQVNDYVKALKEEVEVLRLSDAERVKRQAADKAEEKARKDIAGIMPEHIKRVREAAAAAAAEGEAIKEARKEAEKRQKADAKLSEQRTEAVQELKAKLKFQEELHAAHGDTKTAVDEVEDAYEAFLITQKLKLAGDSAEAEEIAKLVVQINNQKRAIEAIEKAEKNAEKAAKDLAREQNKAAKEVERLIERIADNAQEKIGDLMYEQLKSGHVDFLQFFKDTLLRTVADIAAAMLTQQIVIPIAMQAVGAAPGLFGLTGQAAGVASGQGGMGGFGNILSAGNSIHSIFGGGASSLATGFATSGFGASLGLSTGTAFSAGVAPVVGGLTNAAAAGTGGLSALTGAGSALVAAAPYIAAAVALFALVGPSLFGRNPSVGPTGVARLPNVTGTSEIQLTTDNGGNPDAAEAVAKSIREISTSAAETLGAFGERAFGLDIGSFPQPEGGNSQPAGFNLKRIIDNVMESEDFLKGVDAGEAVTAGVRETLLRAFEGFDVSEVSTALQNSAAKTIEELLSDLDFANLIGTFAEGGMDAVEALTGPFTAVEQAFKNLAKAAEKGEEKARELGLSVQDTSDYFGALREQLVETAAADRQARINNLSGLGGINTVNALLDQREVDIRDIIAAAGGGGGSGVTELGPAVDTSQADQLFDLSLRQALGGASIADLNNLLTSGQITDQQTIASITAMMADTTLPAFQAALRASIASIDSEIAKRQTSVDTLTRAITGLQQGRIGRAINPELSIFDPQEQFRIALEEFNRVSAAASGGDLTAVERFDAAANDTLQAALTAFGRSDERFASVFNQVQTSSIGVESIAVQQLGVEHQQLSELQAIRQSLADQAGSVDSNRDFGARPVRNQAIAALFPEFTADFGGGSFDLFRHNVLSSSDPRRAALGELERTLNFAMGGIMTSHGALPLNRYAGGGIADSPQLAMFGEGRMPEAFVPLPDGRSIPVTMRMPSGVANDQYGPQIVSLMTRMVDLMDASIRVNGAGDEEQVEVSRSLSREVRELRAEVVRVAAQR